MKVLEYNFHDDENTSAVQFDSKNHTHGEL